MKIAVQIINYNNYEVTIKSINAILNNNYKNLHIWLLDNGSPNDSFRTLKKYLLLNKLNNKVTLIQSKTNIGYPAGQNLILNTIKKNKQGYKFHLCLNSDAFVPKNFFKEFVAYRKLQKKTYLIYGFKTIDNQPKYNKRHYQAWNKFFGFVIKFSNLPHQKSTKFWQYYPAGCALMIDSVFFKKVGLFKDELFFYGDEVDICMRLAMNKYNFTILNDISIFHDYGSSTFKLKQKRNLFNDFYYQRSKLLLMSNYFPKRVIFVRLSLIPIIFWRLFSGYFFHIPILIKIIFTPISTLRNKKYEES